MAEPITLDVKVEFTEVACKATPQELAARTREHYERISLAAHEWTSLIPRAIDIWLWVETAAHKTHFSLFGWEFDVYIRRKDKARP